jgi:large subunit ribosomal protein L10
MLRADKERIVAELSERLRASDTLLVADYRGLSMKEMDALRSRLLEHGARFTVVKNSLTRRAAAAAGVEALLAFLEGPTAIAFLESGGDPVAVAKALREAARQTRVLALRGGLLDGRPISSEEVERLAALPTLDVLRGEVLGAVAAPLLALVGLVSAPLRDLVGLLQARVEQLQGGDAQASQSESSAGQGREDESEQKT